MQPDDRELRWTLHGDTTPAGFPSPTQLTRRDFICDGPVVWEQLRGVTPAISTKPKGGAA